MPAFVNNVAFALGDFAESVADCAARGATISSASLLREAGFDQHLICRESNPYDLAKKAVNQIDCSLHNVGAIIYSTCIPCNGNVGDSAEFARTRDVKHLMDFPASRLQADFDLQSAEVIGLSQQACTGMLGSIRLASSLLATEENLAAVLCVTADRFPEEAIYEQAYCLISDGAAACIVSKVPTGYRVAGHHAITNGALSLASDDETVGGFFNYSYKTITAALAKAQLTIADIDWIVPQNTNIKAWEIMARLLNFDSRRLYFPSLPTAGHVISGDNMINLHALEKSGLTRAGDKVLLFMAGYGLNWQCLILEKTDANC